MWMKYLFSLSAFLTMTLMSCGLAISASNPGGSQEVLSLTNHWVGYIGIVVFVIAYAFVMLEEVTHMRKSKPVMLAAGIIWGLIGLIYAINGITGVAEVAIRYNIL